MKLICKISISPLQDQQKERGQNQVESHLTISVILVLTQEDKGLSIKDENKIVCF